MCIACSTSIDIEKKDAFAAQLLQTLNGGVTALMISLGHRSGLFDVMADGVHRSSHQLALDASANERYVREWLGGMVAARIVSRNVDGDTYYLPPEHAHWLSRQNPAENMAVFSQYVSVLGTVEDQVLQCFQDGGGVPYEAYPRFHEVMAEDSGQSIVPILVSEVVPLIPGLHDRLRSGIDVLDIGCGRGKALVALAKAYPNSTFTGYDLSTDALHEARESAKLAGVNNVRFEQRDLTTWTETNAFDWITAFDAIHDQARPDYVLSSIRSALRDDGVFLMQDIDASSESTENIDHPLGALLYGISCMHCMTVSLAQGGMGLGAVWGVQVAEKMLREAGFEEIRIQRFPHDIQNAYFIMET